MIRFLEKVERRMDMNFENNDLNDDDLK